MILCISVVLVVMSSFSLKISVNLDFLTFSHFFSSVVFLSFKTFFFFFLDNLFSQFCLVAYMSVLVVQ